MQNDHSLISWDALAARDAWGFVGVVRVGEHEAFRTLRSYPVPSEARTAVEQLLAHVLGTMLTGQERRAADEPGPGPRRSELGSRG
jgi:hypothetical protein